MCPLKARPILLVAVSLIALFQANAGELTTELRINTRAGSTGLSNSSPARVEEIRSSFAFSNRIAQVLVTNRIEQAQRDYSAVYSYAEDGSQVPLPSVQELNHALELSRAGSINALVATEGQLSETPYQQRKYQLAFDKLFYEIGTRPFVQYTSMSAAAPSDFYTDPVSFQRRARPRHLQTTTFKVGVDQVATERSRFLIEASLRDRPQDRPRAIGLRLGGGYAVTDLIYAQVHLQHWQEQRTETLKDDRGHFELFSVESLVHFDLSFSSQLSLAFGTIVERETATLVMPNQTVGTDILGVDWSQRLRDVTLKLSSRLYATNTRQNDFAISGGLTWDYN